MNYKRTHSKKPKPGFKKREKTALGKKGKDKKWFDKKGIYFFCLSFCVRDYIFKKYRYLSIIMYFGHSLCAS